MVRKPRNGMRVMVTSGFASTNPHSRVGKHGGQHIGQAFVGTRGTIVGIYSDDPTGADYRYPVIEVRVDSRSRHDSTVFFTCKQLTDANTPKFAKRSVRAKSVGENIERV